MNEKRREVVIKSMFMDRLFAIQEYQEQTNTANGRAFVAALFDFIYDIVGTQPLAFPAYVLARYPGILLRRAVFRRRHIILYEVTATEIILLTIFPANRNAEDVEL